MPVGFLGKDGYQESICLNKWDKRTGNARDPKKNHIDPFFSKKPIHHYQKKTNITYYVLFSPITTIKLLFLGDKCLGLYIYLLRR